MNVLRVANIMAKKIPEFNFASLGIRDIYNLNLSKIIALDIRENPNKSKNLNLEQ